MMGHLLEWKSKQQTGCGKGLRPFRYTTLVDAKTYTHLKALKPNAGLDIDKVECINHVAKRLGTGLRKIVSENAGKGSSLGGNKF